MPAEVGGEEVEAVLARQLNNQLATVQVTLAGIEQLAVQARADLLGRGQFAALIDHARATAIAIRR